MIRATFRPAVMVLATILFFLKCKKTIFLKNLSFFLGGGQSPNFHFFWKTNARICLVTTYYIKKVLAPRISDMALLSPTSTLFYLTAILNPTVSLLPYLLKLQFIGQLGHQPDNFLVCHCEGSCSWES